MDKKLTAIFSCLLFAVALGNSAAAATVPSGTDRGAEVSFEARLIKSDPFPVEAGEDAEIYLKIRNTGDLAVENFRAELLGSYPFQIKPDRKTNYSLGKVRPGEEYYISTEVLVAEDAPDGLNDFKVRLYRKDISTVEKIPVTTQSREIELTLANMRTQPTELRPDSENNEMTVQVVNNGEKTAENIVLNLDLPENFEPISSFSSRQALETWHLDRLKRQAFSLT